MKKANQEVSPDVANSYDPIPLLSELGAAVGAAKQKSDAVSLLKAQVATFVSEKQVEIDALQQEYDDAKVAADRLQEQVRALIGELLPMPDPRVRMSR